MKISDWTGERRAVFRLALTEGLGPIKLRRLLDAFGSAQGVLAAKTSELTEILGIGAKVASAIKSSERDADVERAMERINSSSINLLFEDDPLYPDQLREVYDNPVFLTIRGEILPTDKLAIGIVGSRRSTRYGIDQAERFARVLAGRGITIVSGLARGVDGAAHRAALAAGGRTIAVLASGLANVYPPEHEELADRIAEQGAVVSEAPIDGVPMAGLFPQRNRIISGLSLGVLVIEAAERSGALSTAHHAVEQNRDVFAIPGRLTDPASAGTNRLIQKGAVLVTAPEDILEHLGPVELPYPAAAEPSLFEEAPAERPSALGEKDGMIWDALGAEELPVEIIIEKTGLPASDVTANLLMMELKRFVNRLPGGLFRRQA